jgi:hypothetical protein
MNPYPDSLPPDPMTFVEGFVLGVLVTIILWLLQ